MLKNIRGSALIDFPHPFFCSLGLGKAPSCGEKRAGVCLCSWTSIGAYLFIHMLRSMETSWRKGGMWQTGLERRRIPPPLFAFHHFFFFFTCTEKNSYKIQTKQKSCAGEDRNQQEPSCDYKGRLQSALKSQRKKMQAGKEQRPPAVLDPSIGLSGCVSGARVTEIKILPSSHASSYLLLLSLFFFIYCRLPPPPPSSFSLIFSPLPWIEFS